MIEGVKITPLKQILDERGKIMHFFKNSEDDFAGFGEVYFSEVMPNAIKAWHLHTIMDLNYVVPVGKIKMVLFDDRDDSKTKGELTEIFLGPDNYQRIHVPHGVWNGFKGIHASPSLVANMATIPHDKDEIKRLNPIDSYIGYNWDIKHG